MTREMIVSIIAIFSVFALLGLALVILSVLMFWEDVACWWHRWRDQRYIKKKKFVRERGRRRD